MERYLRIAPVVGALLFLACGSVRVNSGVGNLQGVSPRTDAQLCDQNVAEVRRRYESEWAFNRSNVNAPPALGLALSGGGMRSASFSLGVMQGLEETGVLERIDVMSAVSGGSYAMSWYYVQHSDGASDDDLFADAASCSGPQECPRVLTVEANARLVTTPMAIPVGAGNVVLIPYNLLVNGLFGMHVNTTASRPFYESRIKHVFHRSPDGKPIPELSFPALGEVARSRKLPFPIVVGTLFIDDDPTHAGSRFSNTVFEITPLGVRSDVFGDQAEAIPAGITFPRAIAVSGGALDLISYSSGFSQKMFASALNFDLGFYMDNPRFAPGTDKDLHRPPTWRDKAASWWRPLPFYFFDRGYQRDAKGLRLYVSDGGFSDNLAMFPLVRRLTEEIYVVDASLDPDYAFENYRTLKLHVREELGAELWIEDIERWLDARAVNGGARSGSGAKWTNAVVDGTIGYFPFRDANGQVVRRALKVHYVKLSLGSDGASLPAVVAYCGVGCEPAKDGFPHVSTGDQDYRKDRFRAFRELGRNAVVRHAGECKFTPRN